MLFILTTKLATGNSDGSLLDALGGHDIKFGISVAVTALVASSIFDTGMSTGIGTSAGQ
jgi:hypothetical protein